MLPLLQPAQTRAAHPVQILRIHGRAAVEILLVKQQLRRSTSIESITADVGIGKGQASGPVEPPARLVVEQPRAIGEAGPEVDRGYADSSALSSPCGVFG